MRQKSKSKSSINLLALKHFFAFLFLLLLFGSLSYTAFAAQENPAFNNILKQINQKNYYDIAYTSTKQAAIVDHDAKWAKGNGMTATYINFNTKEIYPIITNVPNLFPKWLDEKTALISLTCGTGCQRQLIFIAPQTLIECAFSPEDANHSTSSAPIAIDVKRGLYVCYDPAGNIQVKRLSPAVKVINPPAHASIAQATFAGNQLIINFQGNDKQTLIKAYDIAP